MDLHPFLLPASFPHSKKCVLPAWVKAWALRRCPGGDVLWNWTYCQCFRRRSFPLHMQEPRASSRTFATCFGLATWPPWCPCWQCTSWVFPRCLASGLLLQQLRSHHQEIHREFFTDVFTDFSATWTSSWTWTQRSWSPSWRGTCVVAPCFALHRHVLLDLISVGAWLPQACKFRFQVPSFRVFNQVFQLLQVFLCMRHHSAALSAHIILHNLMTVTPLHPFLLPAFSHIPKMCFASLSKSVGASTLPWRRRLVKLNLLSTFSKTKLPTSHARTTGVVQNVRNMLRPRHVAALMSMLAMYIVGLSSLPYQWSSSATAA